MSPGADLLAKHNGGNAKRRAFLPRVGIELREKSVQASFTAPDESFSVPR